MSRMMHRFLGQPYPVAVAGDGPYVIDSNGKRYLDASSGAGVSCLGYSNARVSDAIAAQSRKLPYVYNAFFTTDIAEQFAERIVAMCPAGLEYVFFGSGGSESMDGALKMALQFHIDNGEPQRTNFIARQQSYHGCAVGGLSVSGNVIRRSAFEPFLPQTHFVSPCYPYRHLDPEKSLDDYVQQLAQELEEKIQSLGPGTVAAFVAEPVVAATLGCVGAPEGYFEAMYAVCQRHGVLFIADEIFTGAGRTGTWLAMEQTSVVPDIVTVAKGLAAGFQPLSAIIVSESVYTTLRDRRGYFMHGHTYNDHATACAAGDAVMSVLLDDELLERNRTNGAALLAALRDEFGDHQNIGDIRGRGMMLGLEVVRDRGDGSTFAPEDLVWVNLQRTAMELGLMMYPGAGCVDGTQGDHILLAPPYILEQSHIDEIVGKLTQTLKSVAERGFAITL